MGANYILYCTSLLVIIITLTSGFVYKEGYNYKYKINEFVVPLDHFSFAKNDSFNFKIRYLVNDSFVRSDRDPILFYTGNEGNIELFAQNTGFLWEAAEQLNALVIFAEHRYYGESLPFGNASYESPEKLGYLSSEQALADYADLLRTINADNRRPVITLGGSYGGMLAAWFRMKYEELVLGAIAASAPIMQFEDIVPCDTYNRILTSVFTTAYKPKCSENIKKSWSLLKAKFSTPEGRNELVKIFNLCDKNLTDTDSEKFVQYLTDVYGNLAMVNYPYKTTFLADLPAYPVREFCGQFSDELNDTQILPSLSVALQVYSNYTGQTKCLSIESAYDSNMGDKGWNFQACTEMIMPSCATGKTDMFYESKWDIEKVSNECIKKFGVRPRPKAAITNYGKSLVGSSNIVFSNGLLDPWSGGGVLRTDNDKISIIIIPDGAHHLDLRGKNPKDPKSVEYVRNFHIKTIREWISEYNYRH